MAIQNLHSLGGHGGFLIIHFLFVGFSQLVVCFWFQIILHPELLASHAAAELFVVLSRCVDIERCLRLFGVYRALDDGAGFIRAVKADGKLLDFESFDWLELLVVLEVD